MDPLVSVLIPVYNADEFIAKALDSCINQTYRNIEILIVDDCSKDTTKEILQQYSNLDKRIRVMYKTKNEGVTIARNNLLSMSRGKYLMFCDADDYFEIDAVNKAVTILEKQNSDCVIFRYRLIKKGFTIKIRKTYLKDGNHIKRNFMKFHLRNPKTLFWGVLWNKCYKTELIRKNNIKFKEGIEDVVFNNNYFEFVKSINVISDCLYNYNQTNISLTRKNEKKDNVKKLLNKNLLKKWRDYCAAHQALIKAYRMEKLSYFDKINLNRYLLSVFLEIKNEADKNKLSGLTDNIVKQSIFLECVHNTGLWKYIITFECVINRINRSFKRNIIRLMEKVTSRK
jgi:glycosyltransferase involved in cell wall biosynthesis